jgi:hypothetical protein
MKGEKLAGAAGPRDRQDDAPERNPIRRTFSVCCVSGAIGADIVPSASPQTNARRVIIR